MMKYISMVAAMKKKYVFNMPLEEVFFEKKALKYPWLSIHIHDPMMKGRSWNLQGMESIENSMDPRAKKKHEEEHEDSKKERKARTTSHYTKNHKTTSLI
jgi:hypothetical protein